MNSRPDLSNPEEIERLVLTFYARVRKDDLLAPVFVDQAAVDWDAHTPTLVSFWCKLELGIPGYQGLPTQKHAEHSEVQPFRAEQFERWVTMFHDTIDRGWRGPHAESIKARAELIARAQSKIVPRAEPWDGFTTGDSPRVR